jgi:hypothetical protein
VLETLGRICESARLTLFEGVAEHNQIETLEIGCSGDLGAFQALYFGAHSAQDGSASIEQLGVFADAEDSRNGRAWGWHVDLECTQATVSFSRWQWALVQLLVSLLSVC